MIKREANMSNIGLSEADFKVFCYGVIHELKAFYAKPENMEAFKKWKAEQDALKAKGVEK